MEESLQLKGVSLACLYDLAGEQGFVKCSYFVPFREMSDEYRRILSIQRPHRDCGERIKDLFERRLLLYGLR